MNEVPLYVRQSRPHLDGRESPVPQREVTVLRESPVTCWVVEELGVASSIATHACESPAGNHPRSPVAHIRQSRPDSGLLFQVKPPKPLQVVPSLLGSRCCIPQTSIARPLARMREPRSTPSPVLASIM